MTGAELLGQAHDALALGDRHGDHRTAMRAYARASALSSVATAAATLDLLDSVTELQAALAEGGQR